MSKIPSQLLRVIKSREDKVPKGHLTCRQWSAKWELLPRRTLEILRAGESANPPLVKRVNYRVNSGAGVRAVPHYYFVK